MLDNLNEQQKKAVMCTEGPLLVLAGAGSGKTRVITRRIAYLVKEKGVSPYNILAITFTNKAAKEMKERVAELLGGRTDGMIISTFHSACVRILRKEIGKIGYSTNFNIYDTSDSLSLLKIVIKELRLNDNQYNPKVMLSKFGAYKDEMISPKVYLDSYAYNYYDENVGKIYREYQNRLQKNNALDFDDIIFHTVDILTKNKPVLEYYQDRFKYILVDEYQDTNKLQFALINFLAGRQRNLCVVGDDDQSIFMWRGADIKNILSFESNFHGATIVKLEQNYRSTANILATANDVIKHNYGRKEKKLWTDKDSGENIKVQLLQNEYQEGRFIADQIDRLVSSGKYIYSDFAVLYRMNAQSRGVEDALIANSIPYRVFGGLEFYKRKEVKDVLAYLKLIYNENDSISFERAITMPKRGIGGGTIEKIRKISLSKGISMQSLSKDPPIEYFSTSQRKNLVEFASLINDFKVLKETLKPSELISSLIEKAGIINEYMRVEPLEYEIRAENIGELVSIALQHENDGIITLAEFLESVSLVSDTETEDSIDMFVSLMTLHSAKGLEFPVVFMIGFEEGIFPSEKSSFESTELEEERRLCYVGITRTKDILYITHTTRRTLFGKTRNNPISRFFNDMSEDRIEYMGIDKPRPQVTSFDIFRPVVKNIAKKSDIPTKSEFIKGDKIIHKRFGRGRITNITKEENDLILEIEFEGIGKRSLLEAYANLQKL